MFRSLSHVQVTDIVNLELLKARFCYVKFWDLRIKPIEIESEVKFSFDFLVKKNCLFLFSQQCEKKFSLLSFRRR